MYNYPKYPAAIPTQTPITGDLLDKIDDLDWLTADWFNAIKQELCAVMTELGVLPKGAFADVAARLAAAISIAAPANGDMIIRSGGAWARLPKGADGEFLSLVNGSPAWVAAPGGFNFRTGDLLLSFNLNTPSGWTDISTTYDSYFLRISNATPLSTGGSNTHSHTLEETNLPSHSHGYGSIAAAAEAAHTHGVGSFANAAEAAHTHGVGSFANAAEAAHTHGVGSFANAAEAAHTHGVGSFANAAEAAHTHSGGTYTATSNGAHVHTYWRYIDANVARDPQDFTVAEWHWGYTENTSSAGAHTHSITGTSAAGSSHNHSISGTSAAGSSHNHAISGSSAAGSSHNHEISGSSTAGSSHNHEISGTSSAGASHTHSLSGSTAAVGSGTAFSADNVPVWLGVRCYQKN